ncbi:MAG: type IV secretion system DNA-binding domain-containing protein, partial [Betaproteobacteria bacterium]|nr:type IV secretion system DNA-binding domain-containing protein [Betaproteobacteria bacterium]
MIALAKASRVAYDFTLAGVPIFRETETDHILVCGAPGSGKGVAIKELLDQIRARGDRAILYDPSGEYVQVYYRHGKDDRQQLPTIEAGRPFAMLIERGMAFAFRTNPILRIWRLTRWRADHLPLIAKLKSARSRVLLANYKRARAAQISLSFQRSLPYDCVSYMPTTSKPCCVRKETSHSASCSGTISSGSPVSSASFRTSARLLVFVNSIETLYFPPQCFQKSTKQHA